MANKHVSLVVRAELASMLRDSPPQPTDTLPAVLHYPADTDALSLALSSDVLLAVHSRYAADAALEAYALPLVHDWLAEKQRNASTTSTKAFADEIVTNLHPVGSYFERYIARFFEDASTALACPGAVAAVGVRSADLATATTPRTNGFTLHSAIYEASRQRCLLDACYNRFEQHYLAAIERFGPDHSETILPSCCDALRAALGALMSRLRNPLRMAEREWLAVTRYRKPEGHVLTGGVPVPWVGLHRRTAARGGCVPLDVILPPAVE